MRPFPLLEMGAVTDVVPVHSGMSKAAVSYLVKQLHLEHASDGLIAMAIHPRWVATDMVRFKLLPCLIHR